MIGLKNIQVGTSIRTHLQLNHRHLQRSQNDRLWKFRMVKRRVPLGQATPSQLASSDTEDKRRHSNSGSDV
eukprot:12907349-Prorocentrum_lima.AAC.1